MARYSVAYSNLIARLDEVDAITSLAGNIAREQVVPPYSMRVRALCRSGVVLLCSHIEGYIEELATLAITRIGDRTLRKDAMSLRFRYHLSRDLIRDIARSEDPEKVGLKIVEFINRDMRLWDDRPNFSAPLASDVFIRSFGTPSHGNIRTFLGRFGIGDFERELARRLKRDFATCTNMIDHVVDQRNKIAHGDFDTAGAPTDLRNMIGLVKSYCRTTDEVVCDWFRDRGCPIR